MYRFIFQIFQSCKDTYFFLIIKNNQCQQGNIVVPSLYQGGVKAVGWRSFSIVLLFFPKLVFVVSLSLHRNVKKIAEQSPPCSRPVDRIGKKDWCMSLFARRKRLEPSCYNSLHQVVLCPHTRVPFFRQTWLFVCYLIISCIFLNLGATGCCLWVRCRFAVYSPFIKPLVSSSWAKASRKGKEGMKKGWSDDEGEAEAGWKQSGSKADDGLVWGEENNVAGRG